MSFCPLLTLIWVVEMWGEEMDCHALDTLGRFVGGVTRLRDGCPTRVHYHESALALQGFREPFENTCGSTPGTSVFPRPWIY
jgi:hypothetical protein